MNVYKFGGASIADPDRMRALMPIITAPAAPLVVVVSALGKTTNALELIVTSACNGHKEEAHAAAQRLEAQHTDYARALLSSAHFDAANKDLNTLFAELQWAIDDATEARYDYSYDQIVCMGELLSTRIFAALLQQENVSAEWIDVRDVLRTDDTYRDARVDWEFSQKQAQQIIGTKLKAGISIVTQGFIGATADNASTTLGREGSDYTAALLAAMLGAAGVTIWKDVEGLQNADPRLFPNTVKIDTITYHEVIEMAYYGAQVIHPKTIKPLQNAGIPLFVKCFLNKDLKGTVIQNEALGIVYPPLIIWKQNQILLQVTTLDFSFITEDNLARIYERFAALNIRINMIQNAAISFIACLDNNKEKIAQVIDTLEGDYNVLRNEGVSLLTIRHYTPEIVFGMTMNKTVLLEQKTRSTVQLVIG